MERIEEIKRNRIMRRIAGHSEIYNLQSLSRKSLDELVRLQKYCLIELRIRMKYNGRRQNF
jgi:hypothetical protein